MIFNNGNDYEVANRPTCPTIITVNEPVRVTRIMTYHWNNGHGAPAGKIALRSSTGEVFGPWQAVAEPGKPGVPSPYWVVKPNMTIPAGSYSIVDSNPSTWAQNGATAGAGMATVEGYRD